MKIRVTMKTPDALDDAIAEELPYAEEDNEETTEKRLAVRELCSRWVDYGEYITIEIDTETETATVVKKVINMTILVEAIRAVNEIREGKQAELDAKAAMARAENIVAQREALRNMLPSDHPGYPVCELLAGTMTIGRESDGYPEISYSEEAKDVAVALEIAGVSIPVVKQYHGLYVTSDPLNCESHDKDYAAWNNAKVYREQQKKSQLNKEK